MNIKYNIVETVKIEDKTVRYTEMFPKLMIPDTEKQIKK